MSYVICDVVCGCDVPKKLRDWMQNYDFPAESVGFKELYSGHSDWPMYCGVSIFNFNECRSVRVADMNLVPTKEQIEEATKLLAQAKECVKETFKEVEASPDPAEDAKELEELLASIPDTPDVVLIWSTS